eukprot:TRINITY_DN23531_c0_g1_i1.p1 TRINITY_DN23531_c0_g1~~TRINITY_DN23531_c0_g1_i1.p1  ORF type:complete len:143 (-),score=46.57 TRINITY_DN23531_c0_g1_i1:119-547(-)
MCIRDSTGFNRKSGAVEEAGSRGKWTETPKEREQKRLAMLAGVNMSPDAAAALPAEERAEPTDNTVYSRGVGKRKPGKSLLEQHQATQGGASSKLAKGPDVSGYQPFDRERDLQIKQNTKLNDVDKMKSQFKMAFGSSGYET